MGRVQNDAIAGGSSNIVISGYENNVLAPGDTAIRAQLSTIIQRLIEKVVK